MPGDGHHAYHAAPAPRRASNPQSGSISPNGSLPGMPGLWRKMQAPRGVGCGGCVAGRASLPQQKGLAACAACLAVVYCGER